MGSESPKPVGVARKGAGMHPLPRKMLVLSVFCCGGGSFSEPGEKKAGVPSKVGKQHNIPLLGGESKFRAIEVVRFGRAEGELLPCEDARNYFIKGSGELL